ncbi:MAG: hypothetical protein R6W74_08270 [Nitrosomonas halophila]
MTTIFFLIIATAVLVGGLVWRRARRSQQSGAWSGAFIAVVLVLSLSFIVWLAIMVLAVGPAMREK